PCTIRSSCSSFARSVRLPFTSMPFVEPRSTTNQLPFSRRTSACRRETLASSSVMWHSRERPSTRRWRGGSAEHAYVARELVWLPVDLELRPGLVRQTELLRLGGRNRGRGGRRRCE